MIVSPRSAHTSGMDVVGNNVGVVRELPFAEGASSVLCNDLPAKELPHFSVRSEFSVSSRMLRIFDMSNTHPALTICSRGCLSSTANKRAVNRAQLIATKSHGLFLKRVRLSSYQHGQMAMRSSSGKVRPWARRTRRTSSPFRGRSPSLRHGGCPEPWNNPKNSRWVKTLAVITRAPRPSGLTGSIHERTTTFLEPREYEEYL
jgi:hypothetical protein